MNASDRLHILNEFVQALLRGALLHEAALEHYQDQRARGVAAFAQAHSPFYRRHWSGCDATQWRTLPTVDKHLMMENFDDFNTRGVARQAAMDVALEAERNRQFGATVAGLTVGLSSGTSGYRGLFLVSQAEQYAWAGTILARALPRSRPPRLRVAFFLRSDNRLYQQVDQTFIQLRYFDLMLPIPQAVAALNELQPHIIVGPPSLLGLLAEQQRTGSLHVQPDRLFSVAEVLEPQDQAELQSAFQAPVLQIYQCTEGLLAVSCERGSLHIQEDLVAMQFEPLDDHGERVTPIVTDLHRQTQPIIRYRLNDVIRLAAQGCACGSPFRVIGAIEGRSDDVCYFEALDGTLVPFFPDTIRRMILLADEAIRDYQAFQERMGHLRIHIEPRDSADFGRIAACVRASVAEVASSYGCRVTSVAVEQGLVDTVIGSKRRRVQRLG